MKRIVIGALVLRGESRIGPKRQRIALLLQSGALRDESQVIMARKNVIGFQTLATLVAGTDESTPIRVLLEAEIPERTALSDCVSSDFWLQTIFI